MAKGRKQIPENLKILQGTSRPSRSRKTEPLPSEPMEKPQTLTGRAAELFEGVVTRLASLKMSNAVFTEMAVLLSLRLAEIETCTAALKGGMTYETTNSQGEPVIKLRPEWRARSDAMKHAQSLLSEFGWSPASFSKVPSSEKNINDVWDFI